MKTEAGVHNICQFPKGCALFRAASGVGERTMPVARKRRVFTKAFEVVGLKAFGAVTYGASELLPRLRRFLGSCGLNEASWTVTRAISAHCLAGTAKIGL